MLQKGKDESRKVARRESDVQLPFSVLSAILPLTEQSLHAPALQNKLIFLDKLSYLIGKEQPQAPHWSSG